MSMVQDTFGTTEEGTPITLYTLTNQNHLEARIMTYGGILVSLRTPDRAGNLADVTLGFDSLPPYLAENPFFGALIGRYGNRIAKGSFQLEGVTYTLARNNPPNHLHGGHVGFHKVIWQAHPAPSSAGTSLRLTYRSHDGEEGYPGNLDITVVYTLTDNNDLRIDYTATTDQTTVVNLTNHTYFNLGAGADVLDHELQIVANHFLPIDQTLIPTGEQRPVPGTAMDFLAPTVIGTWLHATDEQLQYAGGGYDHNWVLDHGAAVMGHAAHVYEPTSGRLLDMYTTQPGVQFYNGTQLNGHIRGKGGRAYGKHAGFCLESQHFPDSPNQPQFPSTVLRPGETYQHTTIYRFGVR